MGLCAVGALFPSKGGSVCFLMLRLEPALLMSFVSELQAALRQQTLKSEAPAAVPEAARNQGAVSIASGMEGRYPTSATAYRQHISSMRQASLEVREALQKSPFS